MTSKLTREQLHERARENVKALKMASRQTAFESAREEILADLQLAELALAAMDSEPVAFTEKHEISNMHATGLYLRAWPADRARNAVEGYTIPLYTTPQPISLVNSEPVAYIFKHPAGRLFWALTDESNKGQNDVMPVYASPQPAPEYPEVLPCSVLLEPGLRFGKGIKTSTMLAALARRAVYESDMAALSPEEIADFQARIEDFKALIAQPAPVVPDGYVMVPKEMTDEIGEAIAMQANCCGGIALDIYDAMLAAAPQEVKGE